MRGKFDDIKSPKKQTLNIMRDCEKGTGTAELLIITEYLKIPK